MDFLFSDSTGSGTSENCDLYKGSGTKSDAIYIDCRYNGMYS